MAEKNADKVTCPIGSSHNVQLVSKKKQPSASVATGNHKTDLTPSGPHFNDKRAKWYYFHL
jgi:hypothetical protein